MKKIIAAIIVMFISTSSLAANNVGQCVFPKTKVAKNGNLEFKKPILILRSPKEKDGMPLKMMMAFKVQAQDGQLIQLMDNESGKTIGWGKFSDFELQDLRNCNL